MTKTWEDFKAEANKQLQEEITLYRQAVKYARHSKKKAKAEKNLEEALATHQLREDIGELPLEELQEKYPHLYSDKAIEERITRIN